MADTIKSILGRCGLGNFWVTQEITSVKWFKMSLDRRLRDIAKQLWYNDVRNNSICDMYSLIKDEFYSEPYLKLLNTNKRINLCKFRTGCHWLPCPWPLC